jgi:formylglycine-generating enzyme required for sulfatase activity
VILVLGSVASAGITIETVPVGNTGNTADSTGYGAVNYNYNIGKYEVTAGQYTAFLNAVADEDTYGLYNTSMWSDPDGLYWGCKIQRSGASGSYVYSVASDLANRPVNYVSFGDAMRFANWLHNGQPTGPQGLSTTEDGAYYLNGATTDAQLLAVVRETDWRWAITSRDEWYKAAYYDPNKVGGAGYWLYPTRSDGTPSNNLVSPDPGNNANFSQQNYYTIGGPYFRTEVGAFGNSESGYSTFDQGGNVWEWNEAIVSGSFRALGGGGFTDLHYSLRSDGPYRSYPTDEGGALGFRVSQVPEPASISLLALGAVGMLLRRRGTGS